MGVSMADGANANGLVGTWRLVSCALHDGRRVNRPYGPDPAGLLCSTPDGHTVVMFGDPNRPPLGSPDWRHNSDPDIAAAARLCIAYVGTYEFRDGEVAHHVAFSLMPNWIGQTLARRFTLSGNTLALATRGMRVDGRRQIAALTWQRVDKLEP